MAEMINMLDPSMAALFNKPTQQATGTDMVNSAADAGMQQAQAEHQAVQQAQQQQAQQEAVNQTLSQMAANALFQNQLLGYKMNYANAEKAGDQAGMDDARQKAAFYRDLLTKDGYDLSGFGADDSLAQAQVRNDYNKAKMMNMALNNTMTSGAYWDQQYSDYRQQGLNDKSARFYATQDAENYQKNQLKDLRSMLFTVGIGPRGNLTPQGTQIMDMMYDENPESIGYLAKAVPSLVAEYAYQTGQEGKNLDYGRQLGIMGAQNTMNLQNLAAKTQAQQFLQNNASSNKIREGIALAPYKTSSGRSSGSGTGSSASEKPNQDGLIAARLLQSSQNIIDGDQMDNAADGQTIDENQEKLFDMYNKGKIPQDLWENQIYPRLVAIQKAYQRKYGYKE